MVYLTSEGLVYQVNGNWKTLVVLVNPQMVKIITAGLFNPTPEVAMPYTVDVYIDSSYEVVLVQEAV